MKLLILTELQHTGHNTASLKTLASADVVVVLKPEPTIIKDQYGHTKLLLTVGSA